MLACAIEIGEHNIPFGYRFWKDKTADPANPDTAAYNEPQSFFNSGYLGDPPNAPIVAQNQANFAAVRPDPSATWKRECNMSLKVGKEIVLGVRRAKRRDRSSTRSDTSTNSSAARSWNWATGVSNHRPRIGRFPAFRPVNSFRSRTWHPP